MQENVTRDGDRMTLHQAAIPGRHIRPRGQDFGLGDVLLHPGRRLTARDIGLARRGEPPLAHRLPRAARGHPGDRRRNCAAGRSHSAGRHRQLQHLPARRHGGARPAPSRSCCRWSPMMRPRSPRSPIRRRAAICCSPAVAPVSATYDLVHAALAQRGLVLDFWKIAMRPGKPLMYGRMGDLPVLGLPGNPVSGHRVRDPVPAPRLGGVGRAATGAAGHRNRQGWRAPCPPTITAPISCAAGSRNIPMAHCWPSPTPIRPAACYACWPRPMP